MDFKRGRVHLPIFIIGIVLLSLAAEKCRLLVGEKSSSQSGKFSILDCFDMSSGTIVCTVKEGVKLYVNNMRSSRVERARNMAIEKAIHDHAMKQQQGISAKDIAKKARKEGAKAAKVATEKTERIIGPIMSSGWDLFESVYYGGSIAEGFLRGVGTLFGTYGGGFYGEERIGSARVGYLLGSQLGSWIGGRIGLMVYDVVNGVHYYLLHFDEHVDSDILEYEAADVSES
ncbi:hypothetical protein LINPERPRIM_LOCUS3104 [Linum perenne]